jgi:hypothetical protein
MSSSIREEDIASYTSRKTQLLKKLEGWKYVSSDKAAG